MIDNFFKFIDQIIIFFTKLILKNEEQVDNLIYCQVQRSRIINLLHSFYNLFWLLLSHFYQIICEKIEDRERNIVNLQTVLVQIREYFGSTYFGFVTSHEFVIWLETGVKSLYQ